jgi:uncharacterized membrane protein
LDRLRISSTFILKTICYMLLVFTQQNVNLFLLESLESAPRHHLSSCARNYVFFCRAITFIYSYGGESHRLRNLSSLIFFLLITSSLFLFVRYELNSPIRRNSPRGKTHNLLTLIRVASANSTATRKDVRHVSTQWV